MTQSLDKLIERAERLMDEAEERGDEDAVLRHMQISLQARQMRDKQKKPQRRRG